MWVSVSLRCPSAAVPMWKMLASLWASREINIHKYSVFVPTGECTHRSLLSLFHYSFFSLFVFIFSCTSRESLHKLFLWFCDSVSLWGFCDLRSFMVSHVLMIMMFWGSKRNETIFAAWHFNVLILPQNVAGFNCLQIRINILITCEIRQTHASYFSGKTSNHANPQKISRPYPQAPSGGREWHLRGDRERVFNAQLIFAGGEWRWHFS